jgi:hypothetical protein
MRRSTLVLVTGLSAGLIAGCASDSDPSVAQPRPTQDTTTPPAASPSPTSAAATPAGTAARAVYYLRDDGHGPRLYREFHQRPATAAVIRDAVTAMLTEPPHDGDYTSLWPTGTTVRGARVSGSTAYVDLSASARRGSAGAEGEAQSLQQLVHTVTAAAPSVRTVQLLVEGRAPATLWGHVDTRAPIARGLAAEVLGPVWLSVPRTLSRGARFGGEASVFEATVSWEFRRGGKVVKTGFSNASTGAPGRGPWSAAADVPAGEYVLRAYESSAKDGTATFIDDKPVTVTG